MTDLRKAAEMALKALEHLHKTGDTQVFDLCHADKVIPALRQALAQPEQERLSEITRQFVGVNEDGSERWVETEYRTVTRSEWVGLTDSEGAEIWADAHDLDGNRLVVPKEIVKRIEAKLKEKNNA